MDKLENMPYFSTNRFNNRFKYSFESCEDEKSSRTTIIVGKVCQIENNIFRQNISIL